MSVYALGPFRLDPQSGMLFRGSEPLGLGRRAVALLRALVERPGAVISKDALIEAAWPGQAIEDSNLTVQISTLRRVLGEAPGGDHWIETMPRRGYRFVGPVVATEEDGVLAAPPRVDVQREAAPTEHSVTARTDVPRDAATIADGEPQRRQITALSCELAGVAAGAGGMDLEDLREAVTEFQLGNSALVLFGYPEAHETDAEQAVRAGLDLCAAVRALRPDASVPMRCRVGIATGMVIVGDPVGVGELRIQEIVGEAPNLAARLLVSAPPDTVAIDPSTRRLIGNLFECREFGAIETADGTEPIRGWQVLGESTVASRFEALRGLALSRLVGRDEEMDLLLRRWARAKAGDGQVVLVSGEPGIGKSRLTAALEERLQAESHLRLSYFCSPHHQDSALFPFIDQLGQAAGFAREDPPATRLEKFEALLAPAAPPDEDVALLADLLSLPVSERHPLPNLSPQRKKERTLEALLRQLDGLAIGSTRPRASCSTSRSTGSPACRCC